jgi:hypothetical protein
MTAEIWHQTSEAAAAPAAAPSTLCIQLLHLIDRVGGGVPSGVSLHAPATLAEAERLGLIGPDWLAEDVLTADGRAVLKHDRL